MSKVWIRPQPHEQRPDPHGTVVASDPNGLALRDAEALVFVRDAYIGVCPDVSFETARRLIGNPPRVLRKDRWQHENPLLPRMCCGQAAPDGRRCGASVHAALKAQGHYYVNPSCGRGADGHINKYGPEIEGFVIALIADALPREALLASISSIELRLDGLRQRLGEVNRRLRRIEADLAEVSKAELEARREGREDDKKHWVGYRIALRKEEVTLLGESQALAKREAALSDTGMAAQLAQRVREMAVDVPTLLRQSVAVRGLTASRIDALTHSINLASVGSHMVLIEVTFLDKTVMRRLVVTGRFVCTQPQRMAAWAWRRDGVDALTIARRISIVTPNVPVYRTWTPREADTLALLHAYFERVDPRNGTHEGLPSLAEQLHFTSDELMAVLLTGALGPLNVDATSEWGLAPTEEEKQRASIDYARDRIARNAGWNVGDTFTTGEIASMLGCGAGEITGRLQKRRGARTTDLAGRIFVNSAALPDRWRPSSAKADRVAEETRRRYERAVHDTVTAAGYPAEAVGEFIPVNELIHLLKANTGRASRGSLKYAISRGSVAAVQYRGPSSQLNGRRPPRLLVRCPLEVRATRDPKVVLTWMGGPERRKASSDRRLNERWESKAVSKRDGE